MNSVLGARLRQSPAAATSTYQTAVDQFSVPPLTAPLRVVRRTHPRSANRRGGAPAFGRLWAVIRAAGGLNLPAHRQAGVGAPTGSWTLRYAALAVAICLMASSASQATTFLIEAERLEMPGRWQITTGTQTVRQFIAAEADPGQAPAVGAIELPHAGKWRLWVRSKDYPDDRPGTRHFTVRLGSARSATVFGKHGRREFDGWAWEDGGTFDLKAGPNLVVVGEKGTAFARCDALVLSDNLGYRPEGVPWKLGKQAAKIVPLRFNQESQRTYLPEPLREVKPVAVATLQNEALRLAFHPATTASGPAIALRAEIRHGQRWVPVNEDAGAESYRILFRPRASDPKLASSRVHPTWDLSLSPIIEVQAGDATARTRLGPATAPWTSAQCTALRPVGVRQVDGTTVELTFAPLPVGQLTATWHLSGLQPATEITLSLKPAGPGHYSLGYHGPLAVAPRDTDFLLLPFMFHGHRFPEQPVTVLSAVTPTPLTLVNRGGVSCALVGEPAGLPFEWPGASNSRYALGLRNETDQAQPLLYSPVLGQPGSVSDGATIRGQFRLWLQRGDWYSAYRRIADEVFQLRDYRRPTTASLSDTALNLFDLLHNEKAAGWDARAKGPWNIESRNTVTQTSPLVYLSYYLLTGDEDFYRWFALPSLEFLMSRPGPHFAAEREIGDNYYRHQPMRGPGSFYGASTLASAFAMTHGRSAAFGGLCLATNGQPRITHGGGHPQPFEDALALYRLTGERRWLDTAISGADQYIAAHLKQLPSRDLGVMPFVNVSFIPDWEGLLHVYEATGERRFLDAAAEGARWLLTTLWTQPLIPEGEMTIHPGGIYAHARHVWWMGDRLFRLGLYDGPSSTERVALPPTRLPEHRAPAWQVSNVGLGLEQPVTYTRRGSHANILMSIWAPNLLRLVRLTQDPAFRTAARNATLGRFANYPGYYLDGFTDQCQRPDYPLAGPDVTSLYVHHIPPFAAYVLDYLFTDAEMRSDGAVAFPSTRQCGYVWFDSRLYGHAPGKVYGEAAWPWLHRTAATVDTINVDRVLAHGDSTFHVVLLNQVREQQNVRVKFDGKVLGRSVEGAPVKVWSDNQAAAPLTVRGGSVQVSLKPLGIAALTLEGVRIDVPTHRGTPPDHFALPTQPAVRRVAIPGTKLEAIGAEILVPPFKWRDLHVYVAAGLDDCRSAVLRYRIGNGAEAQIKAERFPWEFSVRIDDLKSPVTWQVDVQLLNK